MTNTEKSRTREIISLHQEVVGRLRQDFDPGKAIRIGELLTEQKRALKPGEWLPWIEANLPFDHEIAAHYVKLFVVFQIICKRIKRSKGETLH